MTAPISMVLNSSFLGTVKVNNIGVVPHKLNNSKDLWNKNLKFVTLCYDLKKIVISLLVLLLFSIFLISLVNLKESVFW